MMVSCNSIFFIPSSKQYYDPENFGFHPELVTLKNNQGTLLYGWYFKTNAFTSKGTVIQFHGNAENMSSHFQSLVWMVKQGYNLFIFDYSGYGISGGTPSPAALYDDALAVYNWAMDRLPPDEPIILYAESLGVAVAINAYPDFTQKERILTVVSDSGFYSYQEIAREKLAATWLTWPFQHLAYVFISDHYSPKEKFRLISPVPLLIIHGKKDSVVGFKNGERIEELASHPKTFWPIENGAHISTMRIDGYQRKFLTYLEDLQRSFPRK